MERSVPPASVDRAIAALASAGFDIAHAFDAHAAAREPGLELLAGRERLGILIGNTRALWPAFVAARDHTLAHPLDHYVEEAIDRAFSGARIYYGHRQYAGAFVPLQRLAVATGLGALAPSHLVIHPTFGPWFALRAVVVVDGEPVARAPIAQPCRCDSGCTKTLQTAIAGGDWRAWLAVRDACSLNAHRYTDEQIRYHYTKAWER